MQGYTGSVATNTALAVDTVATNTALAVDTVATNKANLSNIAYFTLFVQQFGVCSLLGQLSV